MKVKMNIYAGGGWEGHVVYKAIHPTLPEITEVSSSLESIVDFCSEYFLEMDEDFVSLVKKHLAYQQQYGLVVPNEYIDENQPISSANRYLIKHFLTYV